MKVTKILAASTAACTLAIMPTSVLAQADQTAPAGLSKSPVPVAFEGGHSLGVAAARQRILSQQLGYVLTVGSDGNVTKCELTREFRLRATEIAMCRPFVRHMSFEPALDAQGNPTVGTYEFEIDFSMYLNEDGNIRELHR